MATLPTTMAPEQELPPGTIAPVETGTPQEQQQRGLGPNNENLPDNLKNALRRLLLEFKTEAQSARRDEVRRVRQAHEFWKGLHYSYWAESDQSWHLPFGQDSGDDKAESPRYAYTTNIFQAYGLSIIAVLSQDWPKVRFWPQSTEQPEDITTAETATTIAELVERNNNMRTLMQEEAFLLWCDGKVGGHVRYVTDGQRFGFHPEPVMDAGMRKLGEDVYRCPQCAEEMPASQFLGLCENCGTELGEETFLPAPVVQVPVVQEVRQMPNGQEVISILGSLEIKTPSWAKEQHQFPYLIWQIEAHKAQVRATYPHVATKVSTGVTVGEGATDQFERTARMGLVHGGQVTEGGDITTNLVTFERAWLRPWAFWLLEDKDLREQLLKLFPQGCYVAFAGDVYCESRNESMDDHWRVLHAFPGDGQNRPAVGTSLISVQERYNTLQNIIIETAEHGIPPTFAESDTLDFDALPSTEVTPGVFYPVKRVQGRPVRDAFFTPEVGQVSGDVMKHSADLSGEIGQFLTGAFPALFGGSAENLDTATGYAMARDQALGRIGLVWLRMKQFHADLMLLAVESFRKNRPADVEVPIFGAGQKFKSKWIRLGDLKGSVVAYPESDETYPTVWSLKRGVLQQLMQSADPFIQQVIHEPDNLSSFKRIVGLEELVIPGEESRTKQYSEIEELLAGQPITNQATGEMAPSIVPDPFGDDHEVELATVLRWMNSEQGQEAKLENHQGFLNVRAHGVAHQLMLMAQQPTPPVEGETPGKEEKPPGG